jgi:hypothetical protein
MPDAYSHKTIKTQAVKKMRNAECGIGNQFNSYFFRIPHSEFRLPETGDLGRERHH